MGFQLNGVEYINNSGVAVNGLKSANGTSMAGSNTITTGQGTAASFGTSHNVVGNLTISYIVSNFNASGNYYLAAGYQRRGLEQNQTISASNLWHPTYSTSASYYWWASWNAWVNVGSTTGQTGDSSGLLSGTWRKLDTSFEDPTWTQATQSLLIRVS